MFRSCRGGLFDTPAHRLGYRRGYTLVERRTGGEWGEHSRVLTERELYRSGSQDGTRRHHPGQEDTSSPRGEHLQVENVGAQEPEQGFSGAGQGTAVSVKAPT